MKKVLISFILSLVLFGCKTIQNEKYYSIEKSTDFWGIPNNFNFYRFQKYITSIRKDSSLIEHFSCNFEDSNIFNFFNNIYRNRGFHELKGYSFYNIGNLNLHRIEDSSIIVLDIYDNFSLVCLSPPFGIDYLGPCYSAFHFFLIYKSNDTISIYKDFHSGKLLGIYLNNSNQISGLLFQGYSNTKCDFEGFDGNYNFKYRVNKKGLQSGKIQNVRNGEPYDESDKYKNDSFYIEPILLPKNQTLKLYPEK